MTRLARAPIGARGFDCNTVLDAASVDRMKAHGYDFVMRYVQRGTKPHPYDLTGREIATCIGGGLAVGFVQHVESAITWTPSTQKGGIYGSTAVEYAYGLQLPKGSQIYCDLEGVDVNVPSSIVSSYARAWFGSVARGGYVPALYVGWHAKLTARELYVLPFQHYWAAYNLNADQYPEHVGVEMNQRALESADIPDGIKFNFDIDLVHGDRLGRTPTLLMPDDLWPDTPLSR